MLKTTYATQGMIVAPHHLAAQAGRDILAEGGSAIEAMVAAAATIAVVYPHMNALGGDGFWLIHKPGQAPIAIDACGKSAALATREFYQGFPQIPSRGPLAALTSAATVAGWIKALEVDNSRLPLSRLLAPAIEHARNGIVVTESQHQLTQQKREELEPVSGFADTFMPNQQIPAVGSQLKFSALADTLTQLAHGGLDDFYRGDIAHLHTKELEQLGSPLRFNDLANTEALIVKPLQTRLHNASIFNLPPPTQGLASLMILGIFDQLGVQQAENFAHIHGLVEATKQAFLVRDSVVTDPARVPQDPSSYLSTARLKQLADKIDPQRALPWPQPTQPCDTIWMGCVDKQGCSVSFIQSIYWEFGSGVVLSSGVNWQNRGISFSLDPTHLQALEPHRKPFHTLNPALAMFDDGRVMSYGTMGGEGQPQTQAALFSRYALFNQPLQQAITAPRWLLGRTWGDTSTTLKLESRFDPTLVEQLLAAGHQVEPLPEAFSDTMGHAGAVVLRPDGVMEGASDPRSDGSACAL